MQVRICLNKEIYKTFTTAKAWWYTPVILTVKDAEAGDSGVPG
jgi:hypothetical protein